MMPSTGAFRQTDDSEKACDRVSDEVWLRIFRFIAEPQPDREQQRAARQAYSALCRVSRRFLVWARPELYRHIAMDPGAATAGICLMLSAQPRYAEAVRTISACFAERPPRNRRRGGGPNTGPAGMQSYDLISDIWPSLTGVETISVRDRTRGGQGLALFHSTSDVDLLPLDGHPNVSAVCIMAPPSPALLVWLASCKKGNIARLRLNLTSGWMAPPLWEEVIPDGPFWAACPTLPRLTHLETDVRVALHLLPIPSLRRLVISPYRAHVSGATSAFRSEEFTGISVTERTEEAPLWRALKGCPALTHLDVSLARSKADQLLAISGVAPHLLSLCLRIEYEAPDVYQLLGDRAAFTGFTRLRTFTVHLDPSRRPKKRKADSYLLLLEQAGEMCHSLHTVAIYDNSSLECVHGCCPPRCLHAWRKESARALPVDAWSVVPEGVPYDRASGVFDLDPFQLSACHVELG